MKQNTQESALDKWAYCLSVASALAKPYSKGPVATAIVAELFFVFSLQDLAFWEQHFQVSYEESLLF